ncbi:MAG: GNAT family N-acetyltransferase [Actinobacteria bacterium]|nr:GNAT family N-acetyltransferase [Actinomycetota bacterium]
MRLDGLSCSLRPLDISDAPELLALRQSNRDFLEPWEPRRTESFYTLEMQASQIELAAKQWQAGEGFGFGIFLGDSGEMVGRVALANIVRSAWQNATLGYFVALSANGRGVATEAVRLCVGYAFEYPKLHRVQASVIPRNKASVRVLEKAGFRHEGFAPRFLNINGVWEDHEQFAVTVEEWQL